MVFQVDSQHVDQLNTLIMSSSVHEIKNIFFRMQLNFENLAADLKGNLVAQQKINRITTDFHAIENQLNQLLLSYKSSHNEISIHTDDLELNNFLQSFVHRHILPLESLEVKIEFQPSASTCETFIDENLLQNILDTLVFNAVSMKANCIGIFVEGTAEHPRIRFTDNGPGFPDDFLNSASNLTIRGHNVDEHRFGLGLYFASQLLKAMHPQDYTQPVLEFSNGNSLSDHGGTIVLNLPSAGWVGLTS